MAYFQQVTCIKCGKRFSFSQSDNTFGTPQRPVPSYCEDCEKPKGQVMGTMIPAPEFPVGTKVKIKGLVYDEELQYHTIIEASWHEGWTYRITDFDMRCATTALEKHE